MTEVLLAGADVLVVDADAPPLANAWVLIGDGHVQVTGTGPPPRASTTIDARGMIVMPGLVNAHHHLFQGTSRGITTEGGLLGWLRHHYARWQHLDPAHVAAAARLSLAQLAVRGCTLTAAFEFLHPVQHDFVRPVVDAAAAIGPRLLYVRGNATRLEPGVGALLEQDGVDIGRLIEPPDLALQRTADVVTSPVSDRLQFACGPTTPVVENLEFHATLAALAADAGVPMHVHFHPLAPADTDAVAFAERLHLLRRGNVFAHGSRLRADDVGGLGRHGVGVVHCPSASLLLGYPLPSLKSWLARNPHVAVAVDGAASNDRGSLIGEAQMAFYTQGQPEPAADGVRLPAATALKLVTGSAAATLGWSGAGSLSDGALGDVAAFRLGGLDAAGVPWNAPQAIAGFLRSYQGARAHTVLVGGTPVVNDGLLLTADESEVARSAAEAAAALDRISVGDQER